MLLAIAFFVTVAWLAREVQGMRERAGLEQVLAELRISQRNVREGVRRMAEDFFVMQHLLAERSVVAESDMVRARARLIETPKRKAQERTTMSRHVDVNVSAMWVEDRDGNVH